MLEDDDCSNKGKATYPDGQPSIKSHGFQYLTDNEHEIGPEVVRWHNSKKFRSFLIVKRVIHIVSPVQPSWKAEQNQWIYPLLLEWIEAKY